MPAFSFPFHETRFFKTRSFIYKFKIRGDRSYSGEEVLEGNCFNEELEGIVRTVLGNLDSLQPFSSTHFNVFPYKKQWKGSSKKVTCKYCKRKLRTYPFIIILYLEKNMEHGKQQEKMCPEQEAAQQSSSVSEPQPKRSRRDSPLEEAIVKDFISHFEAERKVCRAGLHMDKPGEEVKEDPGYTDTEFDESDVDIVGGSGTPGEVGEGDEEGEDADSAPGTPVRPGILTRLASHIFPFSLFFKDP